MVAPNPGAGGGQAVMAGAAAGNGAVGDAVQAAPGAMRMIMNGVMMYLVLTNVLNMFMPKPAEPVGPAAQRTVDADGAVQARLPPYPAWGRGTMGALTFAFTLGNESGAEVLPMPALKYASTLGGIHNTKRCPISASFTPRGEDASDVTGPWRDATEAGEFGPILFNYTDTSPEIYAPAEFWDAMPTLSTVAHSFAACRTKSIALNFTGLDLSAAVERNETVFLRVSMRAISAMLPSTTRYFQLTQFRHKPPPKVKVNLLDSVAVQSPRRLMDAPSSTAAAAPAMEIAANETVGDADAAAEDASSTSTDVTAPGSADGGSVATSTVEGGGKTRMYMPPEMPIILAPNWLPVDQLPPAMTDRFDRTADGVMPLLHHHDFWVLKSRLAEVNATTAATVGENFTVSVDTLGVTWALMYVMYEQQYQSQVAMGLASPEDGDILRSILLDNNPWYLGLCVAVSLLRMVFETLAFKNDVQFWRGKKDLRGLSLRSVAINCYFQVVIFLYLLDDGNTSWAVTLPMAIGVVIEFWKLFQCLRLRRDPVTNKIVGLSWNWQEEDETSAHDRQAMRYMMIFGAPCLFLYTIYSMAYEEHSGWYSFFIRTQVRFIYYAGFAMMCPQIFINYKLKSVAAMPWKSFVYKALNTVVDDLFAFVITMPLLHRLACFRDDIVFVILLYQRWIYRVDPTRVNEFGQRGDGQAPDADSAVAAIGAAPTPSEAPTRDTPSPSRAASRAVSAAPECDAKEGATTLAAPLETTGQELRHRGPKAAEAADEPEPSAPADSPAKPKAE